MIVLATGFASFVLVGGNGAPARGASVQQTAQVDVEIAVDGTASMESAIAQVKQAAAGITDGVTALLPDTRFAVVVFRDHNNPAGEYELLQPFTSDPASVKAAISRMKTAFNRDPNNGPAESYNLAFRQSYSDDAMNWRPSSRKLVLVLGDAEPNSAGADGLPGCHDHSQDPEGLSTRRELSNMRSHSRTLIMVREPSREVTASLQCYRSLAAGAFAGGLAEDAGGDLVASIVELIQTAYAPLALKPDLRTTVRNGRMGLTVKLQNPNVLPLAITSLEVTLPEGLRYVRGSASGATRTDPTMAGRTLTWPLARTLAPRQQLLEHLNVRAADRLGTYRSSVSASVETAAGNHLVPHALGNFHVRRRISAIAFRFARPGRPVWQIAGLADARFTRHARAASGHGSLVLRKRGAGTLTLRVTRVRLERLLAPTRARIALRIASAHGFGGCRPGAAAGLAVFYSSDLRADGGNDSHVRLQLPHACGGTIGVPVNISVADR